jgi:hypothetical protein
VNNCSYEREFCNKGITNPHGVFSGIARHNMYYNYSRCLSIGTSVLYDAEWVNAYQLQIYGIYAVNLSRSPISLRSVLPAILPYGSFP